MKNTKKVLVVGLDSMEKDLVLEWAHQGVLPNFARLLETGSWGLTQNPTGLVSGGTWSSFYNGTLPDQHGQYDAYDYFDVENYRNATYSRADLNYNPIWERLGREGKRFVVIDAPYTFLAENCNGIHIMDWATHVRVHPGKPKTWPPTLAAEIDAQFGADPLGTDAGSPCDQEPPRTAKEYALFRDKLLRRLNRKVDLTESLLKREDWDFFLTVFCEPHCIGHHCWHVHDAHHTLHDFELARAVGDPVKDVYIGIDGALGRILSAVDDDTVVFVYSSFGMGPHYSGTDLLDLILQRLEGRRPSEAKEWMMNAMRQAWRRAPTSLRKSLMPIRRHTWERLYHSRMTPDRSTRRFFEMKTNNATGGVRFNLVGRESQGLVQPGDEYDALCGQLTEDLLAMRNADTDEPLVQEVLRTDQIYHGERLSKLPDLLVQWNRSSPIVRATSPKTGFIENRHLSARTGDHKPFGMYIASGSSIPPGRLPAAVSVADLAPMIATILGII